MIVGAGYLFQSLQTVILRLSHSLYFAIYEEVKKTLIKNDFHPLIAPALAGASATCFAEAVATPFDGTF